MVVGHCPRSLITVIGNGPEGGHIWPGKEAPAKHMLLLTILENHEGKTVEMVKKRSKLSVYAYYIGMDMYFTSLRSFYRAQAKATDKDG